MQDLIKATFAAQRGNASALDKESGRKVVDLMKQLATEGQTTIIMVTHDNKILDVADRIIIVEDGALASKEQQEAFVARMREGGK